MQTITEAQFRQFQLVNRIRQCPTGDYTKVNLPFLRCDFEPACVFTEAATFMSCHFSTYQTFAGLNEFDSCTFAGNDNFGDANRFSQCKIGHTSRFGSGSLFADTTIGSDSLLKQGQVFYNAVVGARCRIGHATYHGTTTFGGDCRLAKTTVFTGPVTTFDEGCRISTHELVSGNPLIRYVADVQSSATFYKFTDCIGVRYGAYGKLYELDEFREAIHPKLTTANLAALLEMSDKVEELFGVTC